MAKKKKCNIKKSKSCSKKCDKNCSREKVYGEPNMVKPAPSQELANKALDTLFNQRPVSEYYNLETGEIYQKIFFKESWWTRFKRFLGLVP